MRVSLNWMREFTSINLPIDELVDKIGAQIGAVEEVIDIGARYKGLVVVKVVSCTLHPNADKLSVCLIDDGKVAKGVTRNKDGLVKVVCGAPNVIEGLLVAWIPPGATVPSTYDKNPFVLEARELRGVVSNGMLASPQELVMGDSHEGLLILDKGKPGDDFAKSLWLDDYVIDIENKMFTHRPDCFGQLGVAREIAGITGRSFKSPSWYKQVAAVNNDGRKNVLSLEVINDVPKLVPRFTAVAIKNVKIGPSPAWMQSLLTRVGVKPINNIVDVTNFVMMETGQPLHAYDYDKVFVKQKLVNSQQSTVNSLGIRLSKDGEELKLLGGKVLKLKAGSIIVTDGKAPIGLGGVMGGVETEVSSETTNIVLECANWEMNALRRTAMEYGLFTEAATRFTKGQSPHQNGAALVRAIGLITQLFGGRVASNIIDQIWGTKKLSIVKTDTQFINSRLGLELSTSKIAKLLENVEFKVKILERKHITTQNPHFQGPTPELQGPTLEIGVPFWRTDVEIPEDIVEEVGRLYGYDHLSLVLPSRNIEPVQTEPMIAFKNRIREILIKAGNNEVLTYSFVHGSLLANAGQDHKLAHKLRNALSPDLQYYRLSLIPSLLEKIHPNIKAGFDKFVLFELGRAHIKGVDDKQKLPMELDRLAFIGTKKNSDKDGGSAYFAAKKQLENLLTSMAIENVSYHALTNELDKQWQVAASAYEPNRSAIVTIEDKILGLIGEPSQKLSKSLKLPEFTAQFELDISLLMAHAKPLVYQPLNRFPGISADLCLKTPIDYSYQDLTEFLEKNLKALGKNHGYQVSLEPLDIYQDKKAQKHKQTTWHVDVTHPERTLITQEINSLLDTIVDKVKLKFKAERI